MVTVPCKDGLQQLASKVQASWFHQSSMVNLMMQHGLNCCVILTFVRILSTHGWMKHVDDVHDEFRIEITLFELETHGQSESDSC